MKSKKNILSFLTIYFLTILCLTFLSHKILIKDYLELDRNHNLKNMQILFNHFDIRINSIKNIINDYAKWDKTYEFIQDENKDYIYENFRENTNTLEDLDVDFILFSTLDKKVIFSKYVDNKMKNIEKFQAHILENFQNNTKASTIFKYNEKIFYVIKEDVLKSDFSGKSNGYILAGKYINKKTLKDLEKVFKHIDISFDSFTLNDLEIKLANNILIKTKIIEESNFNMNYIQLFNINKKHIFTIVAKNSRDILKKGERSIFLLNVLLSIFILILLVIFYKNKSTMQRYNSILESKVTAKTKELEEKNKVLEKIAKLDFLTNIKNRRSFFIEGKELLDYSIKNNKDFSLVMIDIDKFKNINDTYGHAIGDEVLKDLCNIINKTITKDDIFGRLGGEEFAIIFKNSNIDKTESIVEKLRKKIENTSITINNQKIKFTISLGLTQRKDELHLDQILLVADQYLYQAKEKGRNRLIRDQLRLN